MASDLERKAKDAFIDDHFELAVDLYSQAIGLSPNNAELFVDRAQANMKLQNFTEAVDDANKAIELDSSMARAYLRKGMACLKLEEYQTSKTALEIGVPLAPENLKPKFNDLIKECDKLIAEEAGEQVKVEATTTDVEIPPESVPLERPKDAQPAFDLSYQGQTAVKPKYRNALRWTQKVQVSPGTGLEGHLDDGYSWRKYGQKDILGAKYPRYYYRCTHRNVQGCLATKQVQRSDEDPTMFDITYRGRHTCNQAGGNPNPPPATQNPPQNQEPNMTINPFSQQGQPSETVEFLQTTKS